MAKNYYRKVYDVHGNDSDEEVDASDYASCRNPDETNRQSLRSSFCSVKGYYSEKDNISSQISDTGQICKHDLSTSITSDENSNGSLSSSTFRASLSEEGDVYSQSSESGSKYELHHLLEHDDKNEEETEISQPKINKCCRCKEAEASHFCESCRNERKYICNICLREHNFWIADHDVVSLSLEKERNSNLQGGVSSISSVEHQLPIQDASEVETFVCSKENMLVTKGMSDERKKNDSDDGKKTSPKSKMFDKKFYKDDLYLGILREQQTREPQQSTNNEKIKKYGTYLIKTRSDKKRCIIIGMSQLENKRIFLADSENSELKILNNETLKVTTSYELPDNPYLTCFVDRKQDNYCIYKLHILLD